MFLKTVKNGRLSATKWVYAILAALPFFYLIAIVATYKVDVPAGDQWDMIPLFDSFYKGELTFADLWGQKAEQRPLFQRAIMIGLAHLTRWDTTYELWFDIGVAAVAFGVLILLVHRTAKTVSASAPTWVIPALAVMIFALNQWENWLWGWGMQAFLNVLACLAAVTALAWRPFRPLQFWLAVVAGIWSMYSYANGVLIFPIGLVVLLFNPSIPKESRVKCVAGWLVASALIAGSFLWGFEKPSYHPSWTVVFEHPARYVYYVFIYLGAPMVARESIVFYSAVANGAVLLTTAFLLIRERKARLGDLIPILAVAGYAVGTAMITGIGRLGFGPEQAQSPRYVTLSELYWMATVILIYLYFAAPRKAPDGEPEAPVKSSPAPIRWALAVLLLLIVGRVGQSSFGSGIVGCKSRHQSYSEVRAHLLELGNDELLMRVYPEPEIARKRLEIVRKYGYSIFRDQPAGTSATQVAQ